jgi:hypothetical protein
MSAVNATFCKKIVNKFSKLNKDIYFEPNYNKIYEIYGDGKSSYFYYSQGSCAAFYPFLINSVNELEFDLRGNYYDIQSVYGYCGVITNSYHPSFIEQFYREFDKFCLQNSIIAEFARFHPLLENHKFSEKNLTVIQDRKTVTLDLTQSYDSIWTNEYSSNNRNMIRKARKEGYTSEVIKVPSFVDVERFISIYYYTMEMAGAEKYYFFNIKFFINTFKYLEEYLYLINVKNDNKEMVCSSIFFHYNDFFHYHLSGRTAKADNTVNNFLLDEAVKFAQSNKAKTFHFGGGRSSAPDDSLLKFKSNFSKTKVPFFIGKKIHNQGVYDEVVRQWEIKHPDKKEKFKNHILKYRY